MGTSTLGPKCGVGQVLGAGGLGAGDDGDRRRQRAASPRGRRATGQDRWHRGPAARRPGGAVKDGQGGSRRALLANGGSYHGDATPARAPRHRRKATRGLRVVADAMAGVPRDDRRRELLFASHTRAGCSRAPCTRGRSAPWSWRPRSATAARRSASARDGQLVEWSYAHFGGRVRELARGLIALGIEAGDRVAILGGTDAGVDARRLRGPERRRGRRADLPHELAAGVRVRADALGGARGDLRGRRPARQDRAGARRLPGAGAGARDASGPRRAVARRDRQRGAGDDGAAGARSPRRSPTTWRRSSTPRGRPARRRAASSRTRNCLSTLEMYEQQLELSGERRRSSCSCRSRTCSRA